MKEVVLSEGITKKLLDIYQTLQGEYQRVADQLDFRCDGCPDNCCDSYFLHHTYLEWAYLWTGFSQLPARRQKVLLARSRSWVEQCREALVADDRPQVMCPLNEDGLCVLYEHRLLVCRTHGVPAQMTRPDGKVLVFPGCFRCQEIVAGLSSDKHISHVERTAQLHQLAILEGRLLEGKRHLLPKVRATIAEMLIHGPPTIPLIPCQR